MARGRHRARWRDTRAACGPGRRGGRADRPRPILTSMSSSSPTAARSERSDATRPGIPASRSRTGRRSRSRSSRASSSSASPDSGFAEAELVRRSALATSLPTGAKSRSGGHRGRVGGLPRWRMLARAVADGRCATVAMPMTAKSPIFDFMRSRGARMSCPFCGHEEWQGWDERVTLDHALGERDRRPARRRVPAHLRKLRLHQAPVRPRARRPTRPAPQHAGRLSSRERFGRTGFSALACGRRPAPCRSCLCSSEWLGCASVRRRRRREPAAGRSGSPQDERRVWPLAASPQVDQPIGEQAHASG